MQGYQEDAPSRAASLPHNETQGRFGWDARMCVDAPQNQGPAQASAHRAKTPAGTMSASRQNMFEAMQELGEGPEAGLWERYTNPLQPELTQRRASCTSGLVDSMPRARDATMGRRMPSASFASNGLPVIGQHHGSQSATHMPSANMLTTALPVPSHHSAPVNVTRYSFETVRSDELAGAWTHLRTPVGGYALPSRPLSPPKEGLDDDALLEQLLAGDGDSGPEAAANDTAAGTGAGAGAGFGAGVQKPLLGPKLSDDMLALSEDDDNDAPGGGAGSGDADWRPRRAPTDEEAACGLRKRRRNGGGRRTAEDKRRDRRRESNRESARRARARKAEETQTLEAQVKGAHDKLSERERECQRAYAQTAAAEADLKQLRDERAAMLNDMNTVMAHTMQHRAGLPEQLQSALARLEERM